MPLSSSLSTGGSVGGPRGGGASSLTLLFILQAINNVSSTLNQVSKDISGMNKATGESGQAAKDAGSSFTDFTSDLKAIGGVVLGVVGAIYGLTEAYQAMLQAGEEGAAFLQTTLSFEQMTKSVGANIGLLDQLRSAARGTIPDMQLMSYATTALAGASGEFGEQMATALPHILEIAKAANKANPALGSVDYQFQSLIIGLKRLSPRLIDNTGLQIKLGAAYEVLAKKLGKNREELTATEQQMALLNATMAAGDILIKQVGGSADSLTDPFNQLKAASTNLGLSLKANLADNMSASASTLTKVVEWLNKYISASRVAADETRRVGQEVLVTSANYEDYVKATMAAGVANGVFNQETANMLTQIALTTDGFDELTRAEYHGQVGLGTYVDKVALLNRYQFDATRATDDRRESIDSLRGSVSDLSREEQYLIEKQKKLKEGADEYRKAMEELSFAMDGPVGKAIDDFTEKQSTLQAKIQDARRELEILTGTDVPLPPGVADLATRFIVVTDQIKFLQDALKKGLVVEGNIPTVTAQITSLKDEAQKLREEFAKQTGLPLTPAQIEKIAELEGKIRDTEEALEAETEAMKRNTKEIMFNMAQKQLLAAVEAGLIQDTNESGSAYDEVTEILTTMARTMGLVDDETVAAAIASQDLLGQLISGEKTSEDYAVSMGELAEAIAEAALTGQNLIDVIARIKDKKVTITLETKIKGPHIPGTPFEYDQFGGPVLPNRPYIVGEVGPELFVPNTAGTIIPNNELQNKGTPMMAGQGISINFYDTKVTNDADIQVLAYRIANEISARQRWR